MRTRTRRDLAGRLVGAVAALVALAAAATAHAQTPFFPYHGKNQIRYDNFRWYTYTTDHFEIYYYPETEQHLERIAGYAESAYQQISADLKHDLAFKVPLIIFKTSSEFQEQNIIPGAAQEGVGAFAEPYRDRMVLPIDEPPDLLYRLIVHELTHIFEFDVIPQSLIRRSVPLWVNEGLSDYMTGYWRPADLMTVRDAAVADIVPKMSDLEGYGGFTNPRLIYNLGHAVFEFVESKWGKEGLRQFLFALRKSVIGGGEDAYEEAFKLKPEEFDQQFEKYLKDRFKPFRDKERPADYGPDLAPNPQKTKYTTVISIEPSPSGDLIAAVVGNRKDSELDIALLSTKDGTVVRNLTNGFDQSKGWVYITYPGSRYFQVSWMSWSPKGDRIAYFVRTEKERALILQNVVTGDIEKRFALKTVDEPESPTIAPDGKSIIFSALSGAVGDLFRIDIESGKVENLTNDAFADYGPTYSPDGKYVVYMARISGNEKLFRLDLDTKKKTQLTFGTHDDAQAKFVDDHTLVFASTGVNPTQPIEPEVAKNGNIFNIRGPGLLGRAARRVALHDEDLRPLCRRRRTIGKLAGQPELAHRRLAADLLLLPAPDALLGPFDEPFEEAVGLGRMAGEPMVEVIAHRRLDHARRLRRRQLLLGLALELGLADEDRQHHPRRCHDVVGCDPACPLVVLELGIGAQRPRQGRPQPLLMRSALGSGHGVAVGIDEPVAAAEPGDGPFHRAVAAGLLHFAGEHILGDPRLAGDRLLEEVAQAAGKSQHRLGRACRHHCRDAPGRSSSGSRRRRTDRLSSGPS